MNSTATSMGDRVVEGAKPSLIDDGRRSGEQDLPDGDAFGDLWVDGFCIISENNSENTYHVVTGSGTDVSSKLDGFLITAGNADGALCCANAKGGGMYN